MHLDETSTELRCFSTLDCPEDTDASLDTGTIRREGLGIGTPSYMTPTWRDRRIRPPVSFDPRRSFGGNTSRANVGADIRLGGDTATDGVYLNLR